MRLGKSLLVLCVVLLATAGARAQGIEPDNLLSNGDWTRGEDGWELPAENAATSFVDTAAGPFKRALRVLANPQPGATPYSIVLRQKVEQSLAQGQPLVLKFWARSAQGIGIGAFIEEGQAPYAKLVGQVVTLAPVWKEFELRGETAKAYKNGDLSLVFHLAHAPGTIELAGVRFFDPKGTVRVVRSDAAPDKPQNLIVNGDFSAAPATTWGIDNPTIKAQIVPANIGGVRQALHLDVTPPAGINPWEVQIGQKLQKPISREDAVYFRAWMRSPQRVQVGLVFEMTEAPNTKTISQTIKLTPDWKQYRFVGYSKQTFAPGEAQVKFFLGYDQGSVEIADVRVENFGRAPKKLFDETIDYWRGATPSDAWRAPALRRIEQLRKGDVRVRVVDAAGHPVRGALVRIEQKSHAFRWGTAGPVSRLLDSKSPDSLRYQQEVKRLFNTFVFESDLKWPNSEEPGKLEQVEQGIAWLKANGIENIRAHNLIWGSKQYLPARVQNLSAAEAIAASQQRIKTVAARLAGKVYIWDVVNEATDNTEFFDKIGWENFANAFRWTRQADPNARLAYNDYHAFDVWDAKKPGYLKEWERIKYLIEHGAPLDVLGEQAHMGPGLLPLDTILQQLDKLAAFGKPLEITEFDLGVPDDKVHGEYVRDFLIAAFSHSAVQSFVLWGFWEGSHWRANEGGAMFRKDWSKRPAQQAYEDLVLRQWWTRAQGQTDAGGQIGTRAFYGTHTLTAQKNGKRIEQTMHLRPGQRLDLVLKLPG